MNTVILFVPQQEAWVVERMGRFHRILDPGLNILVPVLDRVRYVQSLKEIVIDVPEQSAVTLGELYYSLQYFMMSVVLFLSYSFMFSLPLIDNVTLQIDGVLFLRILDPFKASYGVEDPEYAVTQLAQTTMRSELGKLTLDKVFMERESLNANIVDALNQASSEWGIRCLRYEIKDIHVPPKVKESMQMQVEAERRKRATVLESEGTRQAAINVAEGNKQAQILASEGQKEEQINKAAGEANAVLAKAEAQAKAIEILSDALTKQNGNAAASLSIAEQYVKAFSNLAKQSNTILLPTNTGDISSMVIQTGLDLSFRCAQTQTVSASKKRRRNRRVNAVPPIERTRGARARRRAASVRAEEIPGRMGELPASGAEADEGRAWNLRRRTSAGNEKSKHISWALRDNDSPFQLNLSSNSSPFSEEQNPIILSVEEINAKYYRKRTWSFFIRDIVLPDPPKILNCTQDSNGLRLNIEPPSSWAKPHSYFPLAYEVEYELKHNGKTEISKRLLLPKSISRLRARSQDPYINSLWSHWTAWRDVINLDLVVC
ncbi:STML2 protein, partial [Polypterus senegalus]